MSTLLVYIIKGSKFWWLIRVISYYIWYNLLPFVMSCQFKYYCYWFRWYLVGYKLQLLTKRRYWFNKWTAKKQKKYQIQTVHLHQRTCCDAVNKFGHHGLSCLRSMRTLHIWIPWHAILINIFRRTFVNAKILAIFEPNGNNWEESSV